MKDLLIRGNLGLGDHIIMNGLVRHFAKFEANGIIHVPCKAHNYVSVQWMFRDLDNVNVRSFAGDLEIDRAAQELEDDGISEVMRLGGSGNGFDRQFYDQAGVPFEERWSEFYAPPSYDPVIPMDFEFDEPYIFAHEDTARGFLIPRNALPEKFPIIFADNRTPNIFDWARVLINAKEIHCIPSSFSVLVDSGPDIARKLVLHASARPGCELPTYLKNWMIV